jgi:MFS family permease
MADHAAPMALPAEPPAPAAGRPTRVPYGWFLAGLASWFSGWGMQAVLFSWLVVGVLHETPERVGVAQFALVAPSLFLLLVGGATADRVDRRRLLVFLHCAGALLVVALATSVATGSLSFWGVVAYAAAIGSVAPFVVPARDSMLNQVAGENLMRAVVGATMVQFIASGAGSLAGGIARYAGTATTLALQAVLLLGGAWAAYRLPRGVGRAELEDEEVHTGDMLAGIRQVWRSPILRPVWLLAMGVGLFFMGPYAVVFPILVRDYYHGDVGQLSLLLMTFPIGTVLGSLFLLRFRDIRRKGRALARAQGVAACALIVVGLGVPFWVAWLAGVLWGVCGGVFMNAGRTVFQGTASASQRARVLSVYSLGFLGAGTIGSPIAGLVAGAVGPLNTFLIFGAAMLAFVAAALIFTGIGDEPLARN